MDRNLIFKISVYIKNALYFLFSVIRAVIKGALNQLQGK